MALYAPAQNLCDIARVTNLETARVIKASPKIVTTIAAAMSESKKALRRLSNNDCSKRARELKKRNHKLVIALAASFVDKFRDAPRTGAIGEAYEAMSRIHNATTEKAKQTKIGLADLEYMSDSLDLCPTIDFGELLDFDLTPAL